MRPLARLVVLFALVAVVVGLGVHYESADERHSPYPTTTELAEDYDAHVGADALVFGTVRDQSVRGNATPPNQATIEVESDEGPFEMTVHGFDADVRRGGTVQVYGVLEPDRTMDARNVVVVNPAGSSNLYKYAISAVGAALVLVVFFREWRFDTDSLAFEVRDDG